MDPQMMAGDPVRLTLEAPHEVARWRPLVQWLLAIPHHFVIYFLEIGQGICVFLGFFAVLFTRRFPDGLFRFVVMSLRYQWRVMSYVTFMREKYPPFEFDSTEQDPGTDPAQLSIAHPGEVSRFLPLVKWLLAFPHYIALFFMFFAAFFAFIATFFAVLFTGRYPEGIRNFLVGVTRWYNRVVAYVFLLRDEYPPFSLS